MYRKNVAGQYLYFALVNASTGAALTGATVTGKRAIDGAAQGSVTGTITEEAGGQYKIALSQADINGNNIGFLFTATSAIPVSISVVTTAADPTDAVRFGLTSLPNAAAEAAGGLYTRGSGAGQIAQQANGQVDVNVSTIKTQTVTCGAGVTVLASVGTAATSTAQTGDSYARLGAPAGASVSVDIAAVNSKTTNLPASPAATGDAMGVTNAGADAVLDRTAGVEAGWTLRQAMRIVLSALGGKVSGAATATIKFRDTADSKDRISATVDASGNRSAVTLDAS